MADPVFANTMEVSSKSMGGKSIAEFPDVCFTPPLTPATPPGVPLPYPNTGMASDTTSGSTSVKIGGQEVMLKDRSYFKQSTGDEAGCAPKKGMISSKIKGKVYFIAWSMDVKVEGENVVRNLDMTTHNHGSLLANGSVPTVHAAKVMAANFSKCGDDAVAVEEACKEPGTNFCPGVLDMDKTEQKIQANPRRRLPRDPAVAKHAALIKPKSSIPAKAGLPAARSEAAGAVAEAEAEGSECVKKMRCFLRPYKGVDEDGQKGCCKGQTAHHIPPQADVNSVPDYDHDAALCVCMEGTNQSAGSHGKNHAAIDFLVDEKLKDPARNPVGGPLTLKEHIEVSSAAVAEQCGCDKECIQEQLEKSKNFKGKDMSQTSEHVGRTSLKPDAARQTRLTAKLKAKPKSPKAK